MIKYLFEWFGKLNEMARITSLYVIVLHFDCCITFSYIFSPFSTWLISELCRHLREYWEIRGPSCRMSTLGYEASVIGLLKSLLLL